MFWDDDLAFCHDACVDNNTVCNMIASLLKKVEFLLYFYMINHARQFLLLVVGLSLRLAMLRRPCGEEAPKDGTGPVGLLVVQ